MNPDDKTYLDYIMEERMWARRRNWRIVTVIAAVFLFVIASFWWCLDFSVEKRNDNGTFSKVTMGLDARLNIYESLIEEYGQHCGRIRSLVFCGEGFYAFTSSDKVHAVYGEYPNFCGVDTTTYHGDPGNFDFKPIEFPGP